MRNWTAHHLARATLFSLVLASPAAAVQTVDVTTCDQTVPPGKTGVLVADLDCSATTGPGVHLAKRARLRLNGFTLSASKYGVLCEPVGNCAIFGPGTIRRPTPGTVEDESYAVFSGNKVQLKDDIVLENWTYATFSIGTLAKKVTVTGCYRGLIGGPIRVLDSTFTGNGIAVVAISGTRDGVHYTRSSATISRSTFSGNEIDIAGARRPVVRHSTCSTSWRTTPPSSPPFDGGDDWGVCG